MGDRGSLLLSGGERVQVLDTVRPYPGGLALRLKLPDGMEVVEGETVVAEVDSRWRERVSCHHTATHLLHAALRNHLGDGVLQAGSSVDGDRLRFDFTHDKGLKMKDLVTIEGAVNAGLFLDEEVKTYESDFDSAVAAGALAMFDEKYDDIVRVVEIPGLSTELCGGTHADSTALLQPFHIVSESAVAAGTRRIEAVTGAAAVSWLQESREELKKVSEALGGSPQQALDRANAAVSSRKALMKEVKELQKKLATRPPPMKCRVETASGPIELHCLEGVEEDTQLVKERVKHLLKSSPGTAHILVGRTSGSLVVAVPPKSWEGATAKAIMEELLDEVGLDAKGGGSVAFAQGNVGQAGKSLGLVETWLGARRNA